MKLIITIFLIVIYNSYSQNDVFDEKDFIDVLLDFHPEVQIYNLILDQADANVLKNKGAFDPYLYTNFNDKFYSNTEYYSVLNAGINIPVWYGFDINTNFESNQGAYLNPNQIVPDNGLFSFGVDVPLIQGLFFDSRRANLNKAKNYSEILRADQLIQLNSFIYKALNDFWNWIENYNNLLISEDAFKLTKERFENVKQAFTLGDIPAIDTLESYIQLNDRILLLQKSKLKEQKSRFELFNFIWSDRYNPNRNNEIKSIDITSNTLRFNNQIDTANIDFNSIPDIKLMQNIQNENQIDRKLKIEKIKPKLNVKYNFISENLGNNTYSNFNLNDYKWGLKFEMPLLFREGRGDLELADIKIEQTSLKLSQKIYEIENKLKSNYVEFSLLKEQVDVIERLTKDYEILLEAEKTKFFNGESSIFLINSRELKLIDYKLKLIEIKKNTMLSYYKFLMTKGQLIEYFR